MPPSASRPNVKSVDVIDPRWLLKALAVVVAAALVCGYATLCIFFWQGQWQLVLNPSHLVLQTPSQDALPFENLTIGDGTLEAPKLAAWFVPSDSVADPTVLLLHGGNGSMSDTLPLIQLLHTARLNVLTFDYRGFGKSDGPHPSQQTMQADADHVLEYLLKARGVQTSQIILGGQGLGASLATRLSLRYTGVAALLLDQPDGDLADRVAHDPRARLVPTGLLFRDRFPLADLLSKTQIPKLIVTHTGETPSRAALSAPEPKMTVELPSADTSAYLRSLRRFLDQYVARPVPSFTPAAT